MNRGPRPLSPLHQAFLATLVLAAAATAASAAKVEKVSALRLKNLEGKDASVSFEETPVTLVNFWATWCAPCREEMPQIERLSRKYAARGFRAVGIALQSGEPAEVREFLEGGKLGLTYPLLVGDDEAMEAFGGIEIVPTTFLVGRGGRILGLHYGVTDGFEASVGAEIEKHLGAAGEDGEGRKP